jgi:hypothetical protein
LISRVACSCFLSVQHMSSYSPSLLVVLSSCVTPRWQVASSFVVVLLPGTFNATKRRRCTTVIDTPPYCIHSEGVAGGKIGAAQRVQAQWSRDSTISTPTSPFVLNSTASPPLLRKMASIHRVTTCCSFPSFLLHMRAAVQHSRVLRNSGQ